MKKYIGIEGNRLRMKAEMKEPNKGDYIYPERARDPSFYGIRYEKAMKDYEAHLASLPVIPAEFEVEIDREYVELVDFKKVLKIKNDITGPTISDNSGFVALPISKQEASPEKPIDYYEKDGKRWIREDLVRDTIMMEFVKKLVDDGRLRITDGNDEYFAGRGINNPQANLEVSKEGEQWLQVPINQFPPQDDWYCLVAQKSPLLTWAMPVVCWYEKENGWDIPTIAKGHTHYLIPKSLATTPSPSPTIKSAEEVLTESIRSINPDWNYGKTDNDVFSQFWILFDPQPAKRKIHAAMEQYASQFRDSKPSK